MVGFALLAIAFLQKWKIWVLIQFPLNTYCVSGRFCRSRFKAVAAVEFVNYLIRIHHFTPVWLAAGLDQALVVAPARAGVGGRGPVGRGSLQTAEVQGELPVQGALPPPCLLFLLQSSDGNMPDLGRSLVLQQGAATAQLHLSAVRVKSTAAMQRLFWLGTGNCCFNEVSQKPLTDKQMCQLWENSGKVKALSCCFDMVN